MAFDARKEFRGNIVINPGTGPVEGASAAIAAANITTFVQDVAAKRGFTFVVKRNEAKDEDGRFGFVLMVEGEVHEVEMPGLPIQEVRYVRGEDQNIWDFPRLYVDDSSWVWCFAVDACIPEETDDGS